MNDRRDMPADDAYQTPKRERSAEFSPLLSAPLRAALRDDFSPERSDRARRARVRRNLERALLAPATASVDRVDLAMAQRTAAATSPAAVGLTTIGLRVGLALALGAAIGGASMFFARSPDRAVALTPSVPVSVIAHPVPAAASVSAPNVSDASAATPDRTNVRPRTRRHPRQARAANESQPLAIAPPTEPIESAPIAAEPRVDAAPSAELAEELRLLDRASQALSHRASASALALLREHDRRYPGSSLIKESRALRVIALCEAAAPEAAHERSAFLRDEASSPMAARVQSACPDR